MRGVKSIVNYQDCRRLLADELGIHAPERPGPRNPRLMRGDEPIKGAYLNAADKGRGAAYFTFLKIRSSNFIRQRTVDWSLFDNIPPHEIQPGDEEFVNIRPKAGKWPEALRQLFGD